MTDMNNKQISDVLLKFKNETQYKSILIDGPWGCGKTYQARKFIELNKDFKVTYLSLFGLGSIDEINSALYNEVNKTANTVGEGVRAMSKLCPPFEHLESICDSLGYQLGIPNENDIKENTIVIFDDLERLSKKIEFSDLLGYFNRLYLSNCRIICLISCGHLKDERLNDFNDFKEKVFDCIYSTDSVDDSIFDDIFKGYNLPNLNAVYSMLNSNIRFASKINLLFLSILKYFEDEKIKLTDEQKLTLLEASICSIYITFENIPEYKPTEDEKIGYEISCKYHTKHYADGVRYLKQQDSYKDCFNINNFEQLIYSTLDAYKKLDYEKIKNHFYKPLKAEKDTYILNRQFYYLSDEHKQDFYNELIKVIKSNAFEWSNSFQNIISAVVNYSDFEFDDEIIKLIAAKVFKSKKSSDFDFEFAFAGLADSSHSKNKINNLIKRLEDELKYICKKQIDNDFITAFKTKNFYNMRDFIYGLKFKNESEKKDIISKLLENNFYFPDLTGDINESEWYYCHEIARFAHSNGLGNEFIDFSKKICRKNYKNISLVDRFHALIIYNIDSSYLIEELTK